MGSAAIDFGSAIFHGVIGTGSAAWHGLLGTLFSGSAAL